MAAAFVATLCGLLVLLFVSAPVLIEGAQRDAPFYESAATFPMVVLGIGAVCALTQALRLFAGARLVIGVSDEQMGDAKVMVLCAVVFGMYLAAVVWVGYLLASFLLMIMVGRVARLGWVPTMLLSVCVPGALYALFVLGLKVWMPDPMLSAWL